MSDRSFTSSQHKDSVSHHVCHECDKDFTTRLGLVQHWTQSSRHDYCHRCDEHFANNIDLLAHFGDKHHSCGDCRSRRFFNSENGLHAHRRQKHADVYCAPCKRMFRSESNLRSHQRSVTHQGRTIVCPGRGCGKAFVSLAGRAIHWESGTCPSGITRPTLDGLVANLEHGDTFIDLDLIQDSSANKTQATEDAWNGTHYECSQCHSSHATLAGLNAHLNSPAHAQKIYRCPRAWLGCGLELKTLSALYMHMESERCDARQFKTTLEEFLDGLSAKIRRLTPK